MLFRIMVLLLALVAPAMAVFDGQFLGDDAEFHFVVPVTVNASTFNAAGSIRTTTGNITSGQAALTLSSALDFINGEGIIINHAGATFATNPPTGVTVSRIGTNGATTHTYQIASIDGAGGVGVATSVVTDTVGNPSGSPSNVNYSKVTWSAPVSGPAPAGYAVYRDGSLLAVAFKTSWSDTGFPSIVQANSGQYQPFWLPTAPQGAALNDWLQTSISSGGGTTTLTLANTAGQSVTGATVVHDDSVAIQNAINALPVDGGRVVLAGISGNRFNICCTINVGNGSAENSWSTRWGVRLSGVTKPQGALENQDATFNSGTVWEETGTNGWLSINGPLSGWALDSFQINCNYMNIGLFVSSAKDGDVGDFNVDRCVGIGINSTTVPTDGAVNVDSLHNHYHNINIQIPAMGDGIDGVCICGDTSVGGSDTDGNLWENVYIQGDDGGAGLASCMDLQISDTNQFINIHCVNNGIKDIVLNYCANNAFPEGNTFWGGNPNIVAACSPIGTGIPLNAYYGWSSDGSGVCPTTVPGLACNGEQWVTGAGCNNSGGVLTACTTTLTWPSAFLTTNYFPTCSIIGTTHPMLVGNITKTITQITVEQFATVAGATSGTLTCHAYMP